MKWQVLNRPYSPVYICQPFPAVSKVGILHLYHILTWSVQFSSVQSLSPVWAFVTPWTAAQQDSLSITNSQSLLKLMSIESVMPYNYLILSCSLLLLPSIFPNSFPMSQFFASGGQSIGASASVLPMNIQDLFPLGLTGLISLLSEGLSRVFSSTRIVRM